MHTLMSKTFRSFIVIKFSLVHWTWCKFLDGVYRGYPGEVTELFSSLANFLHPKNEK